MICNSKGNNSSYKFVIILLRSVAFYVLLQYFLYTFDHLIIFPWRCFWHPSQITDSVSEVNVGNHATGRDTKYHVEFDNISAWDILSNLATGLLVAMESRLSGFGCCAGQPNEGNDVEFLCIHEHEIWKIFYFYKYTEHSHITVDSYSSE